MSIYDYLIINKDSTMVPTTIHDAKVITFLIK